MGAQHNTLTSPAPPGPIQDPLLAAYVQDLRRRIEILNIQIETLVTQHLKKIDELHQQNCDTKENPAPWKKIAP